MINPRPGGPPVYAQLAEILRSRIASGRLAPGQVLPSERTLQQEYGLGRHTVRKAVAMLRAEGLITFTKGVGLTVREPSEVQDLTPPAGASVHARMPTQAERDHFGLEEVVPVFQVSGIGGEVRIYPADRYVLRMPPT